MRYVRLYFAYAKRSLMSKFIYKANTFVGIIGFLFVEISSLLTLYLLIDVVPTLDGYTKYQIGMLFALTNMAIGIDHLFTDRLWEVAYWEVKDGKLDHMFLRPLPILFQVLASTIQLEALGEMLVAAGLLIVCSNYVTITLTFGNVLLIIIGVLCASIIIASFKIIVASFAFVFKRSGALLQFIYNFATYSKYPLKIFPSVIKFVLMFIIPLGFCIFIPFDTLFNPTYNPYLLCLCIIVITFVFASLAIFIWKKCAKKYESTGS